MSLLDDLRSKADKLPESFESKAPGWIDDVIADGRKKADDVEGLSKIIDGLGVPSSTDTAEEIKKQANAALDIVEKGKKPLVRLGKSGMLWLLAHWENKDEAEARRLYLETQATFEERRAAMHAAGDALVAEKQEREQAWEEVKAVLKELGAFGLKLLFGVIVSAVL